MTPMLPLNDGRQIPQLGFGLWQVPAASTAETTATALKLGYRLVDGAAIYGNEVGLGEGVRASGLPREDIFVTTKVWNSEQGFDSAIRAAEASLERLGLAHVDLLLIHWPCPARGLYLDTWRALIRLREEGRALSIGVSNFQEAHLERIIGETGVTPAVNQVEINPRLQQPALRAFHDRHGIVTQSWTPLGQGQSFGAAPVQAAARRTGKSPAQVILRWHLQIGAAVIPRSTREAGLRENLDLFDFALTEAEMAAMATLDEGRRCGPDPAQFDMA
ncbi:aldo/keto reductase [Rhodobacter calidifons]|uniref:Aldo/keto reductase n=1 Tax=Rhodobacter calidifons TaxID=2715277 RepID=A0ABX0G621_9RHOB|nr:aldo/keto reductase [Rhodobacter calidifons]NHB76289.1 aldo/keto reductase [Rhodobacter calidifons]